MIPKFSRVKICQSITIRKSDYKLLILGTEICITSGANFLQCPQLKGENYIIINNKIIVSCNQTPQLIARLFFTIVQIGQNTSKSEQSTMKFQEI